MTTELPPIVPPPDCRAWLKRGACPYGVHCFFLHDPKKAKNAPHCYAWLNPMGTCNYGDKCWYKHDPNVRQKIQPSTTCKSWRFYGHCGDDVCPFRHLEGMRGALKVCYTWRHSNTCNNDNCPFYHETEREIEQARKEQAQRDCKYWLHNGYCSNANQCHYRHDKTKQGNPKVCYAWRQKGYCEQGIRCPYGHELLHRGHKAYIWQPKKMPTNATSR